MANPSLSTKTREAFTITPEVKRLFQVVYRDQEREEAENETPKINVSELVSKMAFYYEKIRNTVDYKEEHLLRKNAVERILKRLIVIEGTISIRELDSEEVASQLLSELIRAGYLPNNKIPEDKIGEVGKVIAKYLELKKESLVIYKNHQIKEKNDLVVWIISLMASDIEERLGRSDADMEVVKYMYKILVESIKLPQGSRYEKDKNIQIYVGIFRNFLKFDKNMLEFILFKYYAPEWKDADSHYIKKIGKNIPRLKEAVGKQIEHPLSGRLNRVIKRYTVFFSVLLDAITDDPSGNYDKFKQGSKAFVDQIKKVCNKRYKNIRSKLWRAGIRSISYIFITKSVFAVILEVPATKFFGEIINPIALIINITFPAVLLFLIILFTKLPSDANTAKIVEGVREVSFVEYGRHEPFQIKPTTKRGGVLSSIFSVIYIITFFFTFGIVVWFLDKIHFSIVSIIIFLFFLTLVSFFSIRIRKNTKELIVLEPRESIFGFLIDFFYVPIIEVGKWISEKFDRVNVFVFILDFIIEAPFKIFVKITEEWTRYVKERKDDIV